MHYLTKEDYDRAAKKGISKNVVYQRYYVHNWTLEEALTRPVEHRNTSEAFKYWAKVAASKGIDYYTFRYRVRKAKWSIIAAATTPTRGKVKVQEKRFYLTDDDFEIAKSNGISRQLAKSRVYDYGWSIQRAITQPRLSKAKSGAALERALANGIKAPTFWWRIKAGWGEERASTEPVHTSKNKSKLDPEVVEIASHYGVSRHRLVQRIRQGWSIDAAATTPPVPREERRDFGQALKKGLGKNA